MAKGASAEKAVREIRRKTQPALPHTWPGGGVWHTLCSSHRIEPGRPRMLLTIALLSVVVLIPAPAQAQDLDRRIAVQPGGRLLVDLDLGQENRSERVSLEVRSHDADEVWAVADLSGLGASSVKFRLDHDERGVVRLYGRAGGLMSWLFGGPGVHVRV